MPKFLVINAFQFKHRIWKEGATLTLTAAEVKAEAEKGYHEARKNGKGVEMPPRHMSGLIAHCVPADDETAAILSKALGKEVQAAESEEAKAADEAEEAAAIHKEMDELGLAYDRRWQLKRLKNEFTKAKKEKGL